MVFSSFTFIFVYLPLFLGLYFLTPRWGKNFIAMVASLLFYVWGAPKFLYFFLFSCFADYGLALLLERSKERARVRKAILLLSVVGNTLLLLYFKYANFFVDQFAVAAHFLTDEPVHWTKVALPIGISFFTFHKISYIVDVYRGVSRPARNIVDYLLYISFFPQLIAGPIIRYHEIDTQLVNRRVTTSDLYEGMRRFIVGLSRKILLANPMAAVADNAFRIPADTLTAEAAWIGAVAYALQIYFDFSGYSDMAIGLARMVGFRFPENFDRPYTARSFTDFWRRWHMSLSRWMRDYLYIPLGGNRGSKFQTYRNLWIVFFLSGLWHGANWTFVVWGLYHGFFLILDRTAYGRVIEALPYVISRTITFLLVCIGWVFFRSASISDALYYLQIMFLPWSVGANANTLPRAALISDYGIVIFVLCAVICVFGELDMTLRAVRRHWSRLPLVIREGLLGCILLVLLSASVIMIGSGSYSPFIYFQF